MKPNWTAIGFVFAFALSTATIIFTGLMVGAPEREDVPRRPPSEVVPAEPHATSGIEGEARAAETRTRGESSEPVEREPRPATAERQ